MFITLNALPPFFEKKAIRSRADQLGPKLQNAASETGAM
jgi:hypothetical protein